jgi:hypothetical protein
MSSDSKKSTGGNWQQAMSAGFNALTQPTALTTPTLTPTGAGWLGPVASAVTAAGKEYWKPPEQLLPPPMANMSTQQMMAAASPKTPYQTAFAQPNWPAVKMPAATPVDQKTVTISAAQASAAFMAMHVAGALLFTPPSGGRKKHEFQPTILPPD